MLFAYRQLKLIWLDVSALAFRPFSPAINIFQGNLAATAGQPRTCLKTWIEVSHLDTRRGKLFSPTRFCQTDHSFCLTKKPVGISQILGVFPDMCPSS
jgi:hypothetical protein